MISGGTGYGLHTSGTNVDIDVARSGRIISSGYGIYAEATGSKITVEGRVEGDNGYTALSSNAANVEIDVAKGGKVLCGMGRAVTASGDNVHVDNHGTIAAGGGFSALSVFGYGAEVRNSGIIKADPDRLAIVSSGDDVRIVNEKSGTIIGAFQIQTEAGESSRTINHGNVRSEGGAVFWGRDGDDTVKNDGSMTGHIALGSGDDVVDMRGGTLNGAILGAAGDDTLITDKASVQFIEVPGEGSDTVKSSVTYALPANVEILILTGKRNINAFGSDSSNDLIGNTGNNVLRGRGGFDDIDGKGGNDRLFGGTGADVFAFRTGYGKDVIEDFSQAEGDLISLSDLNAVASFTDLMNNHVRNHGDDVWITAGRDRLIIRDIQKNELQEGDFFIM